MILLLPKKAKGFITSIFRKDDITEVNDDKQRLWVEILNKSYEEKLEIKKGSPLGFVVIEPEHLKFRYETQTAKKERKRTRKRRSGTNRK